MSGRDYKVLLADAAIRPEGMETLEEVASLIPFPAYASEADLVPAAGDIDAILARTGEISRAVVRASPRLKIVSRHGAGVDNVDVEACTRLGVVVTTTGDANSAAVSEHAFACLLGVARKVALADAGVRSGRWVRNEILGFELQGKVLGIVGLGRIGSRMARHAKGFDMEVIAFDPYADPEVAQKLDVTLMDFQTLLLRSDFVSLHVPLTAETRNMIGKAELELMKPSAILVNNARGGLIEEEALYEALAGGGIAGAALDVFAQEALSADHPLTRLDNLLCSPHVAGQTEEALVRMSVGAAENILKVFRGEVPSFVVNPEVLENTSRVAWRR